MDTEQAQQKAERARQLLSDPVLKEAFDDTHEALIRAAKLVKTSEEAFKAAIALQVFDLIKGALEQHINTAKVMEFNYRNKGFLDRALGR